MGKHIHGHFAVLVAREQTTARKGQYRQIDVAKSTDSGRNSTQAKTAKGSRATVRRHVRPRPIATSRDRQRPSAARFGQQVRKRCARPSPANHRTGRLARIATHEIGARTFHSRLQGIVEKKSLPLFIIGHSASEPQHSPPLATRSNGSKLLPVLFAISVCEIFF